MNALKPGDIKLSVNVTDLLPGEHEVPLTVRVPGNITLIGEYSVNITVTPPDDNSDIGG